MENNEFQHISDLWKKAAQGSTSRKVYSEKDINEFKMKKSIDLTRSLNKSLLFDVSLKGILVVAALLFVLMFEANAMMITTLIILSGVTLLLMYSENMARKQFIRLGEHM